MQCRHRKREDGMVTIFLSMVMLCVFSLLCGLLESARMAGAEWYLQTAASSALDSVFSQYHRQLWDTYRLLYAEYETEEELELDFAGFMNPYLESGKWFLMELEQAEVKDWCSATQDHAVYLEQQILDYMKFGVWDPEFEKDELEMLSDTIREAGAVRNMAYNYRGHAKEAFQLEKALEEIEQNKERQTVQKQEGLSALQGYDCYGFCRAAERLIREFEQVPGLVDSYERQANQLEVNLRESRGRYEGEREDCSDVVQKRLETEMQEYEAYVKEDGQRRQEIRALKELSGQQILRIRDTVQEALQVQEIIDNWDYGDDEEEQEGPDYAALWAPVSAHFQQVEIRPLSFRHGIKDKKKEGFLKQVERMYNSGLLSLVMPDGVTVSGGILEAVELPSQSEDWDLRDRRIPLYDRLLVNTYEGRFFRNFRTEQEARGDNRTEDRKEDKRGTPGIPGEDGLSYEVEYLLGGNMRDDSNLTAAVKQLLAVREGLNLVYLLSDSAKRAEAKALAMTVTGITGLAPLVLLTEFFILSVWALGEALMDVRGLLDGKKVPMFKAAETWTLGMDGLLSMGQNGSVKTGGGEVGITYLSWLKILLFQMDLVQQEYRMMDMIQMNIRRRQRAFRMRRCRYQVVLECRTKGHHAFFSPAFMQVWTGQADHTYPMRVYVERRY